MIHGLNPAWPAVASKPGTPGPRFAGRKATEPEAGLITTLGPVDAAFQEAADRFGQFLEACGYTVTGLFNETSKPDKDFVLWFEPGLGAGRFQVTFHHESLTPQIRQADYQEALQTIAGMDGIEKTGHMTYRLNGVPFIVTLETPNRPLNPWANDGLTKRAKIEARQKARQAEQAQRLRGKTLEAVPVHAADEAALQAELVPAVAKLLSVQLQKAGLTVGTFGKDAPGSRQVLIEERQGLHGRQLMLRNQNPKLDGSQRNALHHKIMRVLTGVDGIQRLGTISFRLHDVFVSVWSPPVGR